MDARSSHVECADGRTDGTSENVRFNSRHAPGALSLRSWRPLRAATEAPAKGKRQLYLQ